MGVNILTRYYLNNNWSIDGEIDVLQQGEGNLAKPWDTPWEADGITMDTGYSEPFPTGIVEETLGLQVTTRRQWSYERWLSISLLYQDIENFGNIEGKSKQNFEVALTASWSLEFETIFE